MQVAFLPINALGGACALPATCSLIRKHGRLDLSGRAEQYLGGPHFPDASPAIPYLVYLHGWLQCEDGSWDTVRQMILQLDRYAQPTNHSPSMRIYLTH
eukprot:8438289-Pyramimonas_sp.AAC.1